MSRGGGLANDVEATATTSNSTIDRNQAIGSRGGLGGKGADGLGGGSTIAHNQAEDGEGDDGGNGGNGLGGGIYNASGGIVGVSANKITHNRAQGGDEEADDGGSDGQGIGGGVYNLGTFTYDVATVVAHNHASTSNDNLFP